MLLFSGFTHCHRHHCEIMLTVIKSTPKNLKLFLSFGSGHMVSFFLVLNSENIVLLLIFLFSFLFREHDFTLVF